jgi:hypothetical protein
MSTADDELYTRFDRARRNLVVTCTAMSAYFIAGGTVSGLSLGSLSLSFTRPHLISIMMWTVLVYFYWRYHTYAQRVDNKFLRHTRYKGLEEILRYQLLIRDRDSFAQNPEWWESAKSQAHAAIPKQSRGSQIEIRATAGAVETWKLADEPPRFTAIVLNRGAEAVRVHDGAIVARMTDSSKQTYVIEGRELTLQKARHLVHIVVNQTDFAEVVVPYFFPLLVIVSLVVGQWLL